MGLDRTTVIIYTDYNYNNPDVISLTQDQLRLLQWLGENNYLYSEANWNVVSASDIKVI